nr:lamin L3 isoform X1 [Misgurnus anguillicaudatus]
MITSTPVDSRAPATRSSRRSGATPASVSPTRVTRLQEKEDLRHLNDRLANYIERVRQLENDKSSMQLLLEEKEESQVREVGNVRRLYETELADARKSLDATANERARLQIELTRLLEEHRKLTTRNNKKETELNTALSHWRNLEAALNSKEADYANLLSTNRRLENDITDLKTQVSNLESALQNATSQLNSELLRRADAENQFQTLQDQLEFQKHLCDQEVREMRSRYESRLVEVDSGRQKEFEGKLAEAMKQLREEHEAQISQYKDELEKTFSAKSKLRCRTGVVQVGTLERQDEAVTCTHRTHSVPHLSVMLENAKQTAVKNSDFASSTREELAGTKLRLEAQSVQINSLQKQNSALESRVHELEQTLDRERQISQHRLSQKDQEMADMRQQMQGQLEEYQNLLDVKLMLDMEINAYRKMLEGEEKRLNLSPSPIQQSTISRTHSQPIRKIWGKKRKHEGSSSGLSPNYKFAQHSSSQGHLTIEEIDMDGKFIKIKNNSEKDQPVGGWVLRKRQPDTPDIVFQIPSPCVLSAGQMLTIWAAGAGVEQNSVGSLVLRTHDTWGPFGEVSVSLLNPQMEEVAEFCQVCVQGRADDDPDGDENMETPDMPMRRQVRSPLKDGSCVVM